jgi:hypothetical protein
VRGRFRVQLDFRISASESTAGIGAMPAGRSPRHDDPPPAARPAVINWKRRCLRDNASGKRLAGRTCRRYKRRAVWRLIEIGSFSNLARLQ